MLANGTTKKMPPAYCKWCEEKLAKVQYDPFCSEYCQCQDALKKMDPEFWSSK